MKKGLNSLPNVKILTWSKLRAFAEDKIKVAKMMIFVLDRVENIVGKGENPFSTMFSIGFYLSVAKSADCSIFFWGRWMLLELLLDSSLWMHRWTDRKTNFGHNIIPSILTFSQMRKLKEFADDTFKFDENGKKFSKRVENTVGKG